jgi:hypothetical protein
VKYYIECLSFSSLFKIWENIRNYKQTIPFDAIDFLKTLSFFNDIVMAIKRTSNSYVNYLLILASYIDISFKNIRGCDNYNKSKYHWLMWLSFQIYKNKNNCYFKIKK